MLEFPYIDIETYKRIWRNQIIWINKINLSYKGFEMKLRK